MVDYSKILEEVSWRTDTGIVNFSNESHIDTLRTVLIEFGYDNSIADKISCDVREIAKKKKDIK